MYMRRMEHLLFFLNQEYLTYVLTTDMQVKRICLDYYRLVHPKKWKKETNMRGLANTESGHLILKENQITIKFKNSKYLKTYHTYSEYRCLFMHK